MPDGDRSTTPTTASNKPSRADLLAAFDGCFYAPIHQMPLKLARKGGWGRTNGEISHTSIAYNVGRDDQRVIVEQRKESGSIPISLLLHYLVEARYFAGELDFPLTIERGKLSIKVDRRPRVFTVYSSGPQCVALNSVRGRAVIVRAPTAILANLALARMDADEFAVAWTT